MLSAPFALTRTGYVPALNAGRVKTIWVDDVEVGL
jgi:hypothetical protein